MTGVEARVSGLELGGVGDRLGAFDPPLLAPRADEVHRLDPIDQELGVELGSMGSSRQAPGQSGARVASRSVQLKPRMLRVQEGRQLIHGYTCFNMKVVLLRGTGTGGRGCQSRRAEDARQLDLQGGLERAGVHQVADLWLGSGQLRFELWHEAGGAPEYTDIVLVIRDQPPVGRVYSTRSKVGHPRENLRPEGGIGRSSPRC